MDPDLRNAAIKGAVGFLNDLPKDDPRLLIFFDCTPVGAETPLHVALVHGRLEFATEILKLSPKLARMPNERGSYPLHLASARGYVAVVKDLLKIDPSLSCLRDKEGRTALASAALNEKAEALKELYPVYKKQVGLRNALGNEREELILHICVEHELFEMVEVLVKLDKELVKKRDDNGNTALHLAAAKENTQMRMFLLQMESKDRLVTNNNNYDAFDIWCEKSGETEKMKESMVANPRSKTFPWRLNPPLWRSNPFLSNLWDIWRKKNEAWTAETHNTMLLLATLMVTISFQAGLNPPGGFWQEPPVNFQHSATIIAGTAIHNNIHNGGFRLFMYFNLISFLASLTIILSLVSWLPLRQQFATWIVPISLWIALSSMAMAFLFGTQIIIIHDRVLDTIVFVLYTWLGLTAIIFLFNFHVLVDPPWLQIIFWCLVGPLVLPLSILIVPRRLVLRKIYKRHHEKYRKTLKRQFYGEDVERGTR